MISILNKLHITIHDIDNSMHQGVFHIMQDKGKYTDMPSTFIDVNKLQTGINIYLHQY